MFESLKEFNNIVISGPQRSGTRITAKVIAHDTGKTYIDEKDINYHDFRLLEYYIKQGNSIIQCPGLCRILHHIKDKSTLIIMVRRPIDEIINSERRHWDKEAEKQELLKYAHSNGIISRIKYAFWGKVQKPILLEGGREIKYHNLENHKLFIKNRKGFKWDQTQ